MTHNWAQISYNTPYQAHLRKQTFARVKMEENAVKSQEVSFQKSQKRLVSRAWGSARTKARTVEVVSEQFLWFLKMTFCDFTTFSPFWQMQPFEFQLCFIRSTIAYQCPNIIHFDVGILVSITLKKW